jgi:DNA-3-methyladenine glycosylase I
MPKSEPSVAPDDRLRCAWPLGDAAMLRYHDEEWGVPVHDDRTHFEYMILDGAQAGLSWRTILLRREGYRKAFAEFDVAKVARFTERRIQALMLDPGIIRNQAKIRSSVTNAQAFLKVQNEFGSFDAFIWTFAPRRKTPALKMLRDIPAVSDESKRMSEALLARGFKFVGPTICYAYMQAAGMVNDHLVTCFRHAELKR